MKNLFIERISNIQRTFLPSLLLAVFLFASCKKDYRELNKANDVLSLQLSTSTVVLQEKNYAADAISFGWTTGTNMGTNASISYTLRIDIQGKNFSNPVTVDMGKNVQQKKYTVQDLNDLLLHHWNVAPGTETSLEAEVIATVSGNAVPEQVSGISSFRVTPYQPVTSTLYLIGDASANGWDANNATAMTKSPDAPGKFIWNGQLSSGQLKFITTLGQFLPSYNRGVDDGHLFYRTDNAQPDDKFLINTPGSYQILINLLDSSISITASSKPPFTRLWMVGDATPNGWNIDNPNEMRVDSSNLFVFHYNEILNAGEFKIPTATGNWGGDYYMPLTNHPAISSTGVQFVPDGSPDNKWYITNPGPYKIRLDLQNLAISIQPFTPYTQIWMVGDATPVGWNINSPQPMTPVPGDPYTFTYTGPLAAGEFKFPLSTGNWGCDYFMPVIDQSGPGSTQMQFVPGGSPDHKWRITDPGNYKITIDQLRETISIVKQ